MSNTDIPTMLATLKAQDKIDHRQLVNALKALGEMATEAQADPERFVACWLPNLRALCQNVTEAGFRCEGRAEAIRMFDALTKTT